MTTTAVRVPRTEPYPTHQTIIGYILWIFGFIGLHRFFFGKKISGILYMFTLGIFLIGWIVDLFFIPSMAREADNRYRKGRLDYNVAWLLFTFLGFLGVHRFYMGKWGTGILYLVTLGIFGLGCIYDLLTLNEQLTVLNCATERET